MGLYYTHCTQCNADGSFSNMNPNCGQCNGKGKDYIDDTPGQKEHALNKGKGRGPGGTDLELLYDHAVQSGPKYSSASSSSESKSGCFPKETQILVGRNSTVCISSLKKDDLVVTINNDNKKSTEKILKIQMYKNKQLWEIEFTDGSSLRTTCSHSFSNGKNWIKASEVLTGESICFYENGNHKKKEVKTSLQLSIAEDVYNIIVDKNYTFIANGVLAHSFTYFRNYRKLYWSIFSNLSSLNTTTSKNCQYTK